MAAPGGAGLAVKALFFDVFGTLVDWRTSIARESEMVLKPFGHSVDWLAFADAWRSEYQGAMDEVRYGRIPFCKLDVLHRRNLDRILPRFNISGVAENVLQYLNLAWHRLRHIRRGDGHRGASIREHGDRCQCHRHSDRKS